MRTLLLVKLLLVLLALTQLIHAEYTYKVGVGIHDVTGPPSNKVMMGYADTSQKTQGIHLRLRSRAFVFHDNQTGKRFIYVTADLGQIFQSIKMQVVKELQSIYKGKYSDDNVLLTCVHTHSGPGGYAWDFLYNAASLGFDPKNFKAVVSGIVESIKKAHLNLHDSRVFINSGDLKDANINRSPIAYENNKVEERAKYTGDTDTTMTVLRIETLEGKELGMISFFPVHGTSMNKTNHFISSDNKGYAALLFEKAMNGKDVLPGKGPFVSIFTQTNHADVSPNTAGPHCPDGKPCDVLTSTCNGKSNACIASGPGQNMIESTQIIGEKQFHKAMELYKNAKTPVEGPIGFVHTHIDMSETTVHPPFSPTGKTETTCPAALGTSFGAGTTDGPGASIFHQADVRSGKVCFDWDLLGCIVTVPPSKKQIACHGEKKILLNMGEGANFKWVPYILPLQILRLGQVYIIAGPGEFTTMAGRRIRESVALALEEAGVKDPVVILNSLSNAYSQYIATHEEYEIQRYEGASTLYGPFTAAAYTQEYTALAKAMATDTPVDQGPSPPDLEEQWFKIKVPHIFDATVHHFGSVLNTEEIKDEYKPLETVEVRFQGANPNNNYRSEGTYLTVERKEEGKDVWRVVCDDGCWETKFRAQVSYYLIAPDTKVTITWEIPHDVVPGVYRIRYFGTRSFVGSKKEIEGTSPEFAVSNPKRFSVDHNACQKELL